MGRNLQSGERLRPIDLARRHGLSTQAVRNYEQAGALPPAERTPHGYRVYTPLHARALDAFLALVPGHGHATATEIMRAVNRSALDEALRIVDESHARLLDDRRTLRAVEDALGDLAPGPEPHPPSGSGGTFIGPLARELGIRPATLRTWERAGLVSPRRDPLTGYRVYDEADERTWAMSGAIRSSGWPPRRSWRASRASRSSASS
ncbi:MerR family DNA-binding transcriptional regulator [Streptomyces prasinopilosus]|uniref:MerR family DNA-binding transcriptional regulator n=1 Tax=Streptomyces prasinopilosus TaxID=67344 RepID=UPI00099E592A|nr:MerR family DNA-binding transcriptional regulator [Streptomyces prasinopilosus]